MCRQRIAVTGCIKVGYTRYIRWHMHTFCCALCCYGHIIHGPLTRCAKLRVAHAPGIPGTFSPSPTSKETAYERSRRASRHVRHARAMMGVKIAHPRWRGKSSQYSRGMRNPQFYVSGKRPILLNSCGYIYPFPPEMLHWHWIDPVQVKESWRISLEYHSITKHNKVRMVCTVHVLLWYTLPGC